MVKLDLRLPPLRTVEIFNGLLKDEEQARVVPGVVFAIRQTCIV